jgi:hypothetical protein
MLDPMPASGTATATLQWPRFRCGYGLNVVDQTL